MCIRDRYLTDEALESLGETVYIEVCLRVREGQNDGFIDRLIVDADVYKRQVRNQKVPIMPRKIFSNKKNMIQNCVFNSFTESVS